MRPLVEKKLKKMGLKWDEIAPVLSSIDTRKKLEGAVADPIKYLEGLVKELETAAWPIAAKLMILLMRPQVEAVFKKSAKDGGLVPMHWDAVEPALQLIDTPEKLKEFKDDPVAFVEKVRA